jgi:hypothetical protein
MQMYKNGMVMMMMMMMMMMILHQSRNSVQKLISLCKPVPHPTHLPLSSSPAPYR